MSFLKNKFFKIIFALVISICIITVAAQFGGNPVSDAVNTVLSPVYSGVERIIAPVRHFVGYVRKAPSYETEIESLKKEITSLKIENKSREDYIKENRRLKELLDLKEGLAEYETVTARVVSYEPNSWYDTFMLNKGTKSGIKNGDIVITNLGAVGKIVDVGSNWAKVSTILNTSGAVGVKLARTGDVGVVSGDASLAEDKQCRLEYLSNDKTLIKGDILLTSGLGGVYPPDLVVGRVVDIKKDSAGNLEYGVVEPGADFSSLYEVLVITYDKSADEENK
ncbi:MAG: rod shape-determining protein MreC [Clostridiales bacterium]|nr:rod shape-determining protein MreC [Clostridiales bacterium]